VNREIPHYLLLTQVFPSETNEGGRWQFVLQETGGSDRIEAADDEPGMSGERLQLLSVVRGLEALELPSSITLVTASRYIGRGIRSGLADWKEGNWRWERFGEMAPVKNCDLWKRIDGAMQIHDVECRIWSAERLQPARQLIRIAPHTIEPVEIPSIRVAFRGLATALAGRVTNMAKAGYAANF